MILDVVQIGEPVLEQKAKKVEDTKSSEIQKLIDDMLETCEDRKDKAAGLSAPQVGKGIAISICRRTDIEEQKEKDPSFQIQESNLWEVMINPKVTKFSKEESTFWEGCLSVGEGDQTLFGPVSRPETVEIEFFDREGKLRKLTATGFFSHVTQHEIDHVKGNLFLKYVPNPEQNLWTSEELDKHIDETGEFPPIK